ncbi:MAG: hypothetical protein HC846_00905 [Blastocatellia bacterium]|nr:hypothetical protein [Blastocatellia bacterium]
MRRSFTLIFLVFLAFVFTTQAQKKRNTTVSTKQTSVTSANSITPNVAIVIDERLAVLRIQPSLYSDSIQRMRTGKIVAISGSKQADGVTFFRVIVPPRNYGWVQAEAVIGKNRKGDDERLAKLIQASEGFEQVERAVIYLENFPNSPLRPAILLLLGDLVEESAGKLSRDATRQLVNREVSASGAPLHSFYLNHSSLDRYRKLGINYWFNSSTKLYHYNGLTWDEIVKKFPKSNEAEEAKKRLDSLKMKMEAKGK